MNPTLMLKAAASFLGITPEEITGNFEQMRGAALNGVDLLERIDARLSAIEQKLGIEITTEIPATEPVLEYSTATETERQTDGKEN